MKKISFGFYLFIAFGWATCFGQTGNPLFTGAIGVQSYTYCVVLKKVDTFFY